MSSPIILCILDGVGWGRRDEMDAVFLAHTPNLDDVMQHSSWGLLKAHGTAVGLPSDDDMGNSEVGHNAMGAGRIFAQGAKLVQSAIQSGQMWNSPVWQKAIQGKTLHLLGLLSDGNVHSHIDHALAMIAQAHKSGVKRLRLHILTDGRDVEPRSALQYIQRLETALQATKQDYAIASGGGRMHMTMDRYEADWEMVQRGWDCHVRGIGQRFQSATEAISTFYTDPNINDQWIPAFVIEGYNGMEDGDSVILFNFRGDRAIEISQVFDDAHCQKINRDGPSDIFFAGMMEYDGDLHIPKNFLVNPPEISDTVGDRLSAAHKKVLSISETQKFGHVTFFFNGNRSSAQKGETWQEIPSDNCPFDQRPNMKALEITHQVIDALKSQQYDHIRCNIANGDMVGHTGNLEATIQALNTVDQCLGMLITAAEEAKAILLITADHGNADEMGQWDSKKQSYKRDNGNVIPSTSHSKNPVPCILFDPSNTWKLKGNNSDHIGGLSQIGATILELCGLEVPKHYLPSLLQKQPLSKTGESHD